MVGPSFREKLKRSGAPFNDVELNAMSDYDAAGWLARNSDDPWLFHMARDRRGLPVFISKRDPPVSTDAFVWFSDMEDTYVATRLLAGASCGELWQLVFHLAQQVVEKGAKSILALQHTLHGTDFVPRVYGHRVERLVDSIEPDFVLPNARIARMREVAQAFGSGHSVGKYQVDTGGGFGMGLELSEVNTHWRAESGSTRWHAVRVDRADSGQLQHIRFESNSPIAPYAGSPYVASRTDTMSLLDSDGATLVGRTDSYSPRDDGTGLRAHFMLFSANNLPPSAQSWESVGELDGDDRTFYVVVTRNPATYPPEAFDYQVR